MPVDRLIAGLPRCADDLKADHWHAAAHGIMRAAQSHQIPVSFGVLTTNTADEALARAGDGPANKGREAARAAWAMARLYATIAGAS